MASYDEHSLLLFSTSVQSIVDSIEKAVTDISELTNAMASQAQSVGLAVGYVKGREIQQVQEVRTSRSNFLTLLDECRLFVERFDKMLRYGNIDENWKTQMLESASQGNFRSFSVYMNQLIRYLNNCSESYEAVTKSCAYAKKQFDNISENTEAGSVSLRPQGENSRRFQSALIASTGIIGSTGLLALAMLLNVKDTATAVAVLLAGKLFSLVINRNVEGCHELQHLPCIDGFLPCVSGAGIFVIAVLFNYCTPLSLNMGVVAMAAAVFIAGSYLYNGLIHQYLCNRGEDTLGEDTHDDASRSLHNLQLTFFKLNQEYASLRTAASKLNSSVVIIRDALSALSAEGVYTKGDFDQESFDSALKVLVEGMQKAHATVQQCYQRLNTGITVAKL